MYEVVEVGHLWKIKGVQNTLFLISSSTVFSNKPVIPVISLHRRCNLMPVGNVYEAMPISWFWAISRLKELLEMHLKFLLNLIAIPQWLF